MVENNAQIFDFAKTNPARLAGDYYFSPGRPGRPVQTAQFRRFHRPGAWTPVARTADTVVVLGVKMGGLESRQTMTPPGGPVFFFGRPSRAVHVNLTTWAPPLARRLSPGLARRVLERIFFSLLVLKFGSKQTITNVVTSTKTSSSITKTINLTSMLTLTRRGFRVKLAIQSRKCDVFLTVLIQRSKSIDVILTYVTVSH